MISSGKRANLNEVYLQTNYVIETPNGEIVVRVGEKSELLDELLEKHQARSWVFLTAYNPYSKQLADNENRARQRELLKILEDGRLRYFNGRGEGENWPFEPSVFIFDIERDRALQIARDFEQNAIVWGQMKEAAELVWCH